jgi:diguanylate cyclase
LTIATARPTVADERTLSELVSSSPRSERARHLRFVRRVHRLRTLGLGLGALCVAAVLRLHDDPIAWWVLLGLNGFVWPHVAAIIATRSADPRAAEIRNLVIDSALGGVWVAAMRFNVLPTVMLVTMLSVDKVSVGGLRLLARTSIAMIVACAATSALLGFAVDFESPTWVIAACIPFIAGYPLAISHAAYRLARRVRRQNRRLEELGRTDTLTGLFNRRQSLEMAELELARHLRSGRPATLVMLDVDRFKRINDRYGHPVGDDVLRRVASTLRQSCRTADSAGRYGGDEFIMLLPDTDLRGAEEAARRIQCELDRQRFEHAPGLKCTVSFGAAEAGRAIASVDAWIRQADMALYRAKVAGRDRFEAAVPAV